MTIILNWRTHRIGPPRPCLLCRRPALLRNDDGHPCHKVCAETLIDRFDRTHRKADAA